MSPQIFRRRSMAAMWPVMAAPRRRDAGRVFARYLRFPLKLDHAGEVCERRDDLVFAGREAFRIPREAEFFDSASVSQ